MKAMKSMMMGYLLIIALVACNNEDFDTVTNAAQAGTADTLTHVAMHFVGGVTPFTSDDGTTRAANDWQWQDGAVVYLQFFNGTERIRSHAVYTKSTDTWEIPTWTGNIGTKDKCEVYYFDGASTANKTSVTLGSNVGVYADRSASYVYDNGTVTVSAALTPQTSRIRFLKDTRTSVTGIEVEGITTYTAYDATTNTLTTSSDAISATVSSSGYTSYIYGNFTDASTRQLGICNNVEGKYKQFVRTFGSSVMQAGHSGYITIPTEETNKGWTVKELPTEDTEEGHQWIDLGLSVCWAVTNVGATTEGDYGSCYAWGETATKGNYSWSTYKYGTSETSLTKYNTKSGSGTVDNKTQLDLTDDAARVNWGGKWRMPTYDEQNELNTKCTWTWTTSNGNNGYRVTGPNGKSIFLPAAGCRDGTSSYYVGTYGYYWSSSLNETNPEYARYLNFTSGSHYMGDYGRFYGRSVRAVISFDDESSQINSRTFTITGNGKTVSFTMKRVAAGTFQMGGSDSNAGSDEKPVHSVTLTKSYYMGETEVTQALWYAVMGQKPTSDGSAWSSTSGLGDSYPTYFISYEDCESFISQLNNKLSSQLNNGEKFRFPTEAQWEYAARGGNRSQGYLYAGSNTIGDVAWYTDNSGSKTHEVKGKQANELGLYDMSGNVLEWCLDWYGNYSNSPATDPVNTTSASDRVYRGGGWYYDAGLCRVAYRDYCTPARRSYDVGLRLALQ